MNLDIEVKFVNTRLVITVCETARCGRNSEMAQTSTGRNEIRKWLGIEHRLTHVEKTNQKSKCDIKIPVR